MRSKSFTNISRVDESLDARQMAVFYATSSLMGGLGDWPFSVSRGSVIRMFSIDT